MKCLFSIGCRMALLAWCALSLGFLCACNSLSNEELSALYGISADSVFDKMVQADDPEKTLDNAVSCRMTQHVRTTTENAMEQKIVRSNTIEISMAYPSLCAIVEVYPDGMKKSRMMVRDKVFDYSFSGECTEVTGAQGEWLKAAFEKQITMGSNRRALYQTVEFVPVEKEDEGRWYCLKCTPKNKYMNTEYMYVNKETFLLEQYKIHGNLSGHGSETVTTVVEAYKTFPNGLKLPIKMRQFNNLSKVNKYEKEIRVTGFEINSLPEDCACIFNPEGPGEPNYNCPHCKHTLPTALQNRGYQQKQVKTDKDQ